MKITVVGDRANEEVEAAAVEIPGVDERFALHRSIGVLPKAAWSMTHVDTGFSVGHGDTPDEAIEDGRKTWLAATPAQRLAAKTRAIAILEAREIQSGSLQ